MPRMRILSAAEQAQFDQPPLFNSEERKKYFEFSGFVVDTATFYTYPAHTPFYTSIKTRSKVP